MNNVYRIVPLEKKSICWHIEMFRNNDDGTISWFNVDDHYRWGQGFVEEELDCNLPYDDDSQAYARTDVGWGAELDDQHACWFEFSDDIDEEEQEYIRTCYLEGDPNGDGYSGASWLFDSDHGWEVEDDYLVIDAPFRVSLCRDDGTVIEENVKLRNRKEVLGELKAKGWPFDEENKNDA